MKGFKIYSICLFMMLFILGGSLVEAKGIESSTKKIEIDGEIKNVNIVTIDLNNPDIELETVISNDVIGGDEDFKSMVERKKMDAAINANFFDAYKGLEPYGTIMNKGNIIYLEGENASLGVKDGNKVTFDRFRTVIKGNLNGKKQNEWNNETQAMEFYLFDVWYVNNLPLDNTGVYMYTPERGESLDVEGGTSIEVIDNKISKVLKNVDKIDIPQNGYIIYYASQAADEKYIDARFKIGRTVDFSFECSYSSNEETTDTEEVSKNEEITDIPEAPKEPTKLFGSIDKMTKNYWDNANNKMAFKIFNIWYVNTKPIDSTGVYLYTPERGETLQVPNGNAVIVEKGEVKDILYNTEKFDIPKDGFVIYYGKDAASENYIKQRFEKGKTVDFYDSETLKINTNEIIKEVVEKNKIALYEEIAIEENISKIDLNETDDLISAGPYLIKEGQIIVDAAKEGFKEDKIVKNKAQRSAIGVTKDNKLLLITVGNTNMEELAEIMLNLGAVESMNLDGGASSALYANGNIITQPGRRLSTVLAVYDHSKENLKD